MSKGENLPTVTPQRRPPALRTTYLAQSIQLEEGTSPRSVRFMIYLLALVLISSIAWSMFASLDQVARADGQVLPSSAIRLLQHLEGGIVADVLVEEGQIVEDGDLLLLLSPTFARSELAKLRAREASLAARFARLNAFVIGGVPDFVELRDNYPALVREQEALLTSQNESRRNQLSVLSRQINERKVALKTLHAQKTTIERSVELVAEEATLREGLMKKGLTPRFKFLDVLRLLNTTRGQLLQIEGLIARAKEGVEEARTRLAEVESRLRNDALSEGSTISGELAEIRESMARYEDRVERLAVRAPVRGVVQKLTYSTVGSVVAAGEAVAEIVPLDDRMIVEVKLNPKDVGFVEIGQVATVRFTAYDYAQFGGVSGHVRHISPTTVAGDTGKAFYKVVLELDDDHVGAHVGENRILPGMVVQADIRTGQRTLLEYLSKPVSRALSLGFTER
jgi:membrane fusion protein, adhesin transport system